MVGVGWVKEGGESNLSLCRNGNGANFVVVKMANTFAIPDTPSRIKYAT